MPNTKRREFVNIGTNSHKAKQRHHRSDTTGRIARQVGIRKSLNTEDILKSPG